MSEWRLMVTPLTPIHIGAGEEIEPFEYVITDNRLYKFDPETLILALSHSEQDEFVSLAGVNLLKARQFLHARRDLVKQLAEYSLPVSPQAAAEYEKRLTNPQSDLSVGMFIRTRHAAYIPGSSLKGALRTGLLYARAHKPISESRANWLEARTFGFVRQARDGREFVSIQDDPFKTLKISDSQPQEMTRLAAVAVYARKAEGGWKDASIPLLREVTRGLLSDGDEITLTHPLVINQALAKYDRRLTLFSAREIVLASREFYGKHLEQEAEFHRGTDAEEVYLSLLEWNRQLTEKEDVFLMRLGWGTGFDGVTVRYRREGAKGIGELRPPKFRGDRGRQEPQQPHDDPNLFTPASRRLVEGGFPLGWAEVRIGHADEPVTKIARSFPVRAPRPAPPPQTPPADVSQAQPRAEENLEEKIRVLAAEKNRPRREKSSGKPKNKSGERARRELDEIHKRTREQK